MKFQAQKLFIIAATMIEKLIDLFNFLKSSLKTD